MQAVKYYPVIDCDDEGSVKAPLTPVYTESIVKRTHPVWLTESVANTYRLCCTDAGSDRLKGQFIIRCPKCNQVLRQISSGISEYSHGLYECCGCANEK